MPASPSIGWRGASSLDGDRGMPCRRWSVCGAPAPRPPSTCSARRPSPPPRPTATRAAATRRCARSRTPRATGRPGPRLEPRVNLSVKVTALTPRVRAEAPELGDRGCAGPASRPAPYRARGRRPPARRHGVDGFARARHRARAATARRARVPRRPVGRDRAPGLPARRRRAARPPARRRCPAHHRAARQGRVLGARDRRGAPARLAGAGVRDQGRERPQLRAADAKAAGGAAAGPGRDRFPQRPLARPCDRGRR